MDTLSYFQNTKHRAISSSDIRLVKQQKGNGCLRWAITELAFLGDDWIGDCVHMREQMMMF